MSATSADDGAPELWETVKPHIRDDVDAMPGPIIEAIRDRTGDVDVSDNGLPTGDRLWKDVMLPELDLPGFGDIAQDDCGEAIPHACECCGNVVEVGRTCAQSTCRRCASTWCRQQATRWASKIMQTKAYRYGATGIDQRYHHLIVSPPEHWTSSTPREDGREIVHAIMSELGIEGVAPFHPYRGAEEVGDDGDDLDVHQDVKPGDLDSWGERVFSGRAFEGDVRDELRFAPHWHLVGVGGFVRGGELTKAVEDATGWVIHRVSPPGETYSIKDERALCRVLAYCYSHAGIRTTDAGNHRVEQTYHKDFMAQPTFTVGDGTHAEADRLVRDEAWRVLGIPSASMTCLEVDADGDDHEGDRVDASASGDGDRDGATSSSTTDNLPRCRGALRAIDDWDTTATRSTGQRSWRTGTGAPTRLMTRRSLARSPSGGRNTPTTLPTDNIPSVDPTTRPIATLLFSVPPSTSSSP